MKILKFLGIICLLLFLFLVIIGFNFVKDARDYLTNSSSNDRIELIEKSFGNISQLSLIPSSVVYPDGYYKYYRNYNYNMSVPSRFPIYVKDIVGTEPEFSPEDLSYFYDGDDMYAFGSKIDSSIFCGNYECFSDWFYYINKEKKATLIASQVAMGGLTDVDSGGGPAYSKTGTTRSSVYFKDKRGNLFITLQGRVYLLKAGKIIGKVADDKTKFFSKIMFSDYNNTYIGDPVYTNSGGYLKENERRIYKIEI